MHGTEETHGARDAADVLVLLARLANERPEVIRALKTLLGAMLGEPGHALPAARDGSIDAASSGNTTRATAARDDACAAVELHLDAAREARHETAPEAEHAAQKSAVENPAESGAEAPTAPGATEPAGFEVASADAAVCETRAPEPGVPSTPAPEEAAPAASTPTVPAVPATTTLGDAAPSFHARGPLKTTLSTKREAREDGDDGGLAKLLQTWNPSSGNGGLSAVVMNDHAMRPSSPFERHEAMAREVATIATAQARRLRLARRARAHDAGEPRPSEQLSDRCIHDWTAQPGTLARLESAEIHVIERWYALVARAFEELERWFGSRTKPFISSAEKPALNDRLTVAALAQKGLYSWISQRLRGGGGAVGICGVQQRAFDAIRDWARREPEGGFGVFIQSGLQLHQAVTTDEQRRIDSALDRFDAEAAPIEPHHAERPTKAAATQTARFGSVADAYEQAKRDFGDLLVFTERAEDSAERSPFRRPDEVFDFFEEMHAIARSLATGEASGRPLAEVFEQRGFAKKPCSTKTMKRHHRFYHATYRGREVDLSQHVTLGSRNQNTCLSIHWWHDEERRQFVILHCGKHLPNTLT